VHGKGDTSATADLGSKFFQKIQGVCRGCEVFWGGIQSVVKAAVFYYRALPNQEGEKTSVGTFMPLKD